MLRLGGSHQPVFLTWAVEHQKPTACLLSCCCTISLEHSRYKEMNSGHHLGGSLILPVYALTQSFGCLIGYSMVWCLGLAPLAVVECCWLPSLFSMIILGHIGGHVTIGVDKLQVSSYSSVASSGCLRKPAKLVQQLQWFAHIIQVWEVKPHQLLCWALR